MFRLKLLDELLKIAATVAMAIVTGFALCEYILKPLWHIVLKNV